MSNQQDETRSEAPEVDAATEPAGGDRAITVVDVDQDVMLGAWVAVAGRGSMTMGVTLFVGGAVVTGTLVGPNEWLDLYKKMAEKATGSEEIAEAMTKGFRVDDPDDVTWTYVHLRGAYIVSGHQRVPGDDAGILWRGRLSEVTAWSPHQLNPSV